jgi:heterodisulfide reductase subunit B
MLDKIEGACELPVYYFTQLMAIALGASPDVCHFELNRRSSLELLKSKNLIAGTPA